MSELSSSGEYDMKSRPQVVLNNNPKYNCITNLNDITLSGLTATGSTKSLVNTVKGLVYEHYYLNNHTENLSDTNEMKLMLDTQDRLRWFIETHEKRDEIRVETCYSESTAKRWTICFKNIKGDMREFTLFRQDLDRLILGYGVERINDIKVGNNNLKSGYGIPFINVLQYVSEYIFGLDKDDYWFNEEKLMNLYAYNKRKSDNTLDNRKITTPSNNSLQDLLDELYP